LAEDLSAVGVLDEIGLAPGAHDDEAGDGIVAI